MKQNKQNGMKHVSAYKDQTKLFVVDVDKTNKSKECMLCHYCYFLQENFSYGPYLCDGCYNMTQKSIDSENIVIAYFKGYL